MRKAVAAALGLVVLAMYVASGLRGQQSTAQDRATAQAQLTVVARPVPSPTP